MAVSSGAVSLNTRVLPLLEAAGRTSAHTLVVLAPAITHEALATLLANDAMGVFPGGLWPLQLLVPAFHVPEVVERIARFSGTVPWDGQATSVRLGCWERLQADANGTRAWSSTPPGLLARAGRWLRRYEPAGAGAD